MKILPISPAALSVCVMQPVLNRRSEGRYQRTPRQGDASRGMRHYTCTRGTPKTGLIRSSFFSMGQEGQCSSGYAMKLARKAGKIGDFAVVFPKIRGHGLAGRGQGQTTGNQHPKELLPGLEKEHALTRDRRQRTIKGFPWGGRLIYWGPST